MFLSLLVTGEKCSGPCTYGHRCSSDSKEPAKEIQKMHDDCHYFAAPYCWHHCALYPQTLEEIILQVKHPTILFFFLISLIPLLYFQINNLLFVGIGMVYAL